MIKKKRAAKKELGILVEFVEEWDGPRIAKPQRWSYPPLHQGDIVGDLLMINGGVWEVSQHRCWHSPTRVKIIVNRHEVG